MRHAPAAVRRGGLSLADGDGATEVVGEHDDLPPGLSAADNEAGWRESLAKLAALVETDQ